MRNHRFELAAREVYECGKPWAEADADVCEAIDFCEYYGRQMLPAAGPRGRSPPGEVNFLRYRAARRGRRDRPVELSAGHPDRHGDRRPGHRQYRVIKPAEQSSAIAYQLVRDPRDVGFPDGVLTFLPGLGRGGRRPAGRAPRRATSSPSPARGRSAWPSTRRAAVAAGQHQVKRVIAEMGGKNAIIIDDDADLDQAVPGYPRTAFGYAGTEMLRLLSRDRAGRRLRRVRRQADRGHAGRKVGPAEGPRRRSARSSTQGAVGISTNQSAWPRSFFLCWSAAR